MLQIEDNVDISSVCDLKSSDVGIESRVFKFLEIKYESPSPGSIPTLGGFYDLNYEWYFSTIKSNEKSSSAVFSGNFAIDIANKKN